MAILIDSDVIIRAEKGLFDLESWIASRPNEQFKLAAITVAELWHGVERAAAPHRLKRRLFLDRFLSLFEFVPYTEETAYEHARLWAKLESIGQVIGPHDLILAATALHTENAVATFNVRHFSVVPGLQVITPQLS